MMRSIQKETFNLPLGFRKTMKSYEDHLESLLSKSPTNSCHRASAIFPIFFDAHVSMRLLFLNYWLLKRKIDHLLCRLYLRDLKGNTVFKKFFYVDDIRGYSVDLSRLIGRRYPFGGSLEIEFASPENLVFPYPAVVVHYQGAHFSTVVHSAQRTFNDDKDQKESSRPQVVESGFNIYADKDCAPFLTYINGPRPLQKKALKLAAYNLDQKVIGANFTLNCAPFQTQYISLEHWKELRGHLNGQAGCIKASLPNSSSFPRLLVGNRNRSKGSMSVTHTYYDLTQQKDKSDYWKAPNDTWHAAALMLPLKESSKYTTRVYFYPIYSPAEFWIDLELYTLEGKLVKKVKDVHRISLAPTFSYLDLNSYTENLDTCAPYSFKLVAHTKDGSEIPSRIKIGFDVGFKSNRTFPCNICTNFYPANPALDQKSKAFRWAPLMPPSLKGSIWCHNDAPKKSYKRSAKIKLNFYRERDMEVLTKKIEITPNATYLITLTEELFHFLGEDQGWCTFESDNPYITTYYFSEHSSGVIGGDHGF